MMKFGKKKMDMAPPPPKKKRKVGKVKVHTPKNFNTITKYFGSRLSQPKAEDEQKLSTCAEERVDINDMDICEEMPRQLSQASYSQLSPFSFCPDSEDADASQSEMSDWLRTTSDSASRSVSVARKVPSFACENNQSAIVLRQSSDLMRALSLESSQSYLTPSDQPVRNPTPLELDQSLLENRRTVFSANDELEVPPPCYVNQFIGISKQKTAKEINLCGSGKYFKEYKQEGRIGKGSFGEVFKCRNRFDGCLYAVKRVKKSIHNHSSECLKREARVFAALAQTSSSSSHVIRYIQSWEEQSDVFIVMEYCENGTLASRLGQPMTNDTLLQIFEQIGDALRAMHRFSFVHLDVKPSNILITDTFQFKLSDFGLTSKVDVEDEVSDGDRRYMSQELLDGSVQKPQLDKTDIFSLGASVYEMHVGKALPDGGLEWTLLRNPEFSFGPQLEPFVKELIQRTMDPDCDSRPTACELVNVIRDQTSNLCHVVREQEKMIAEKDLELEHLRSLLARTGRQSL